MDKKRNPQGRRKTQRVRYAGVAVHEEPERGCEADEDVDDYPGSEAP